MSRRSLAAQQRARAKEVLAQTKSMQTTMTIGKQALQVAKFDLCYAFRILPISLLPVHYSSVLTPICSSPL